MLKLIINKFKEELEADFIGAMFMVMMLLFIVFLSLGLPSIIIITSLIK